MLVLKQSFEKFSGQNKILNSKFSKGAPLATKAKKNPINISANKSKYITSFVFAFKNSYVSNTKH